MTPAAIYLFSFDTLTAASAAREALLAAGLQAQDMELQPASDEAGPVEGNWVAGNGIAVDGSS